MPELLAPEIVAELSRVPTIDIGHLSYWGALDPRLRPVIPGKRIAGTAVTLILPATDSALLPYVLGMTRPGDILVIDRLGDRRYSCLGGTVALAAKIAGVAGIVVDGVAADFDEIRECDFPVWCRGASAQATKLLATGGAINVPVSCGGVAVNPGDAVIADDSGVFVIDRDDVNDALALIRRRQQRDVNRAEQLRAGKPLAVLNGVKDLVDAAVKKQNQKIG